MKLTISEGKKISELQEVFSMKYPFLKLELYRISDTELQIKKNLNAEAVLKNTAGNSGSFDIVDTMSVAELGKLFMKYFGLRAVLFRKAGVIWLETTLTADWTLRKQNDQGREITNPLRKKAGEL